MMQTFSGEVRQAMLLSSNGCCQCSKECVRPITEFDHIISNTKANNKLFPLFLHSPFNCLPINQHCHKEKGQRSITLRQAEVYEEYLKHLKLLKEN